MQGVDANSVDGAEANVEKSTSDRHNQKYTSRQFGGVGRKGQAMIAPVNSRFAGTIPV
jgi:hypothetical protein